MPDISPAPGGATNRPVVELKVHPSPHPFVRRGLVVRPPRAPSGSLVTVHAPGGIVLGDAFWNDTSEIALRRLTDGDVRFDTERLTALLDQALALREGLPGAEEAVRLVHAEGDGLSGLIVDRYGEVLVAELYSAGWAGWVQPALEHLHARLGTRHHRVGMSERVGWLEGIAPFDARSPLCPDSVRITEHGVRYKVDLASGHKTGFFCDQRANRQRLAQLARGHLLDLCCHTGGFAVAAAVAGHCDEITAIDLDEAALEVAKDNANLNQKRVRFSQADAFDWLRQAQGAGKRFETVVLDPPKFIPSRRDEETGRGKYHDLNRLAFSVVAPGGWLLTCSCSGLLPAAEFRQLVTTAARKAGRRAILLDSTGAGPDHPVLLECPETEYLKCLWIRVW